MQATPMTYERNLMPPAFANTKQAAAFALLLLFLLAAPWLANKTFLPERGKTYSSQSIRWEKFPWMQKFIFEETNDIDIAFVGSSLVGEGINTAYVQQKLDERLGHKTVVRSISYQWSGFDFLFFMTKDLLAHRHVNTLVFCDEAAFAPPNAIHQPAPYWFRFGEDGGALGGLPLRFQAGYYYAAVIGMPRNLLEIFVSNLRNEPKSPLSFPFTIYHAANPETALGCIGAHLGCSIAGYGNTNFTPYEPQNGLTSQDVCVCSPATATNFVFSDREVTDNHIYFAKQFAEMAKAHGCNLVELHMPWFGERTSPVINETRDWRSIMQSDVCLIGIPPSRLFAGLSESEIKLLYVDTWHLNINGQKYWTSLFTPPLIKYYESHSHH